MNNNQPTWTADRFGITELASRSVTAAITLSAHQGRKGQAR